MFAPRTRNTKQTDALLLQKLDVILSEERDERYHTEEEEGYIEAPQRAYINSSSDLDGELYVFVVFSDGTWTAYLPNTQTRGTLLGRYDQDILLLLEGFVGVKYLTVQEARRVAWILKRALKREEGRPNA